jgi:hypothetical protein
MHDMLETMRVLAATNHGVGFSSALMALRMARSRVLLAECAACASAPMRKLFDALEAVLDAPLFDEAVPDDLAHDTRFERFRTLCRATQAAFLLRWLVADGTSGAAMQDELQSMLSLSSLLDGVVEGDLLRRRASFLLLQAQAQVSLVDRVASREELAARLYDVFSVEHFRRVPKPRSVGKQSATACAARVGLRRLVSLEGEITAPCSAPSESLFDCLLSLFPVVVMRPNEVAHHFPAFYGDGSPLFDVVLFDEASQLPTLEALPSLGTPVAAWPPLASSMGPPSRARQVVHDSALWSGTTGSCLHATAQPACWTTA